MLELPPNHPDYVSKGDRLLGQVRDIRDLTMVISLGAHRPVFRWLENAEKIPPVLLLIRATLAHLLNKADLAQRDFMTCFQMMDMLEIERTSNEVTVTARLAFFALRYLPWNVIWQPIERMVDGENTAPWRPLSPNRWSIPGKVPKPTARSYSLAPALWTTPLRASTASACPMKPRSRPLIPLIDPAEQEGEEEGQA